MHDQNVPLFKLLLKHQIKSIQGRERLRGHAAIVEIIDHGPVIVYHLRDPLKKVLHLIA